MFPVLTFETIKKSVAISDQKLQFSDTKINLSEKLILKPFPTGKIKQVFGGVLDRVDECQKTNVF
jgi:hypothetical protein